MEPHIRFFARLEQLLREGHGPILALTGVALIILSLIDMGYF